MNQETKARLEKIAGIDCPKCKGKGGFGAPGWEDDPDAYYGDCRDCDGTGLWLPMLSNPCGGMVDEIGGMQLVDVHDESCCSGTGRIQILDDPERLDAAAEKLGMGSGIWTYADGVYAYLYGLFPNLPFQAGETTRLEARQAAFVAVVKAVWSEVEGAPTD